VEGDDNVFRPRFIRNLVVSTTEIHKLERGGTQEHEREIQEIKI
jgi:hypothetical protein